MLDSGARPPLPSREIQERYGAGYFHGVGSGFSSEGYGAVHATWHHWIDFASADRGRGARWLDVGCAYGFLVADARAAGFRATGVDASRFAAAQGRKWAPAGAPYLACAHGERLPFAARSFDVVSAFDVLEHVPDPDALLAEAARVLAPGGLFLAATPDPLTFDRSEPTHIAERVPARWVRALERAGFAVALRFFQAPYNCELVARRGGEAPAVAFDRLDASEPVLRLAGDAHLSAALRSGFGGIEEDGTRIASDGAMVHLLNRGDAPLAVELAIELVEATPLTLHLDGRVVGRFPEPAPDSARGFTPEQRVRLLVPAGGHGLRLGIGRGWAHLRAIALTAAHGDRDALRESLPFDLYERYALAAAVAARVLPGAGPLLDVGGTMGGGAGHLAWTGDFFPEHQVTVVDRRPADYAQHLVVEPGAALPFADRSFAVVTALDVLEHVPRDERAAWLEDVWRVTDRLLLLGNPFATPGVEAADRYLFELIRARYGYEHGFLAEHLAHGHPELDATRDFFAARGASVAVLPSGSLHAWTLLQTVNAILSHPEQDWTFAEANRVANQATPVGISTGPAYRHLLVVDRSGADHTAVLASLAAAAPADAARLGGALSALATGRDGAGDGGAR